MRPTTIVVRSDEPLSAAVGDGLVLFSVEKGKYYAFDEVTTTIWEKIKAPISVGDLCRGLQESFEVTPAQCEADVVALLQDLHARGLVTILDPAAST